jgi:hypothetical protein
VDIVVRVGYAYGLHRADQARRSAATALGNGPFTRLRVVRGLTRRARSERSRWIFIGALARMDGMLTARRTGRAGRLSAVGRSAARPLTRV